MLNYHGNSLLFLSQLKSASEPAPARHARVSGRSQPILWGDLRALRLLSSEGRAASQQRGGRLRSELLHVMAMAMQVLVALA